MVNYSPLNGQYTGIGNDRQSFVTVGLKITNQCNLDCYHCCRYGEKPDISLEKGQKIIDKLAEGNVARINITGGEPLIVRGLWSLLPYVYNKTLKSGGKFSISLTTNGIGLSEEVADSLSKYLDSIKLSLFALGEGYSRVTGSNGKSYARALSGISNAVSHGVPVHVQTAVLRENIGQINDIGQVCEDYGVSIFTLYSIIKQARGVKLNQESTLPDEQIKIAFEKLVEEKVKRDWSLIVRWLKWPQNGQYVLVFPDGSLTANPTENPPENFEVVGNLFEDTVDELWKRYGHKKAHIEFYSDREPH